MTRRVDTKTAELVEIALLTHAAFERERGMRYADIAGLPRELTHRIFSRPPGCFRSMAASACGSDPAERRKTPRETVRTTRQ